MWAAGQEHACPISSQYPCQVDFYQQYLVAGFSKQTFIYLFMYVCISLCRPRICRCLSETEEDKGSHGTGVRHDYKPPVGRGWEPNPDCLEEPSLQLQSDF